MLLAAACVTCGYVQLDLTKTTDGKASFLHVLADAVQCKCPELISFGDDLPTVADATRGTCDV